MYYEGKTRKGGEKSKLIKEFMQRMVQERIKAARVKLGQN